MERESNGQTAAIDQIPDIALRSTELCQHRLGGLHHAASGWIHDQSSAAPIEQLSGQSLLESDQPLAELGVGPGIGVSVARRFASEGFPVGVVARSRATVDAALAALAGLNVTTHGVTADAADEVELSAAIDELGGRLGVPDVVVYNAAIIQFDSVGELSVAQHLQAWAVNVVGAITTAARMLPAMADLGRGTFVITGGMPTPVPDVASLSLGKAGVRALAEMLDTKYGPAGVHVATVTVGGAVAPDSALNPDVIADEYWRLHVQPSGSWEREVLFTGAAARP